MQQRSQTLLADVANMCAASTEPLMARYVEKCDLSKRNQLREKRKKTIGVKNMMHCRALLLHSCSMVKEPHLQQEYDISFALQLCALIKAEFGFAHCDALESATLDLV